MNRLKGDTAAGGNENTSAGKIMQLSALALNGQVKKQLTEIVSTRPYPLLIVAEEGSGKHSIAWSLAASFLCFEPLADGSCCMSCPSCNMLAAGGHLDLQVLDPGPSGRIRVDEIREKVAAGLYETPRVSRTKVFIISAEKADSLSESCQNALLKPLEEHPDFVRFIIFTEDSDRLLPTIRSRVQSLRPGKRSEAEIRQILSEQGISDRSMTDFAAQCSEGLPGMALTLAQDEKYREIYDESLSLFKFLAEKDCSYFLTEGLDFFKENKENTDLIIRLFQSFLRELSVRLLLTDAKAHLNSSPVFSRQEIERYRSLAIDYAGILELMAETRRALSYNVNYDLTISRFLLRLKTGINA